MQIYVNAYLQKNLGDDLFLKVLIDRYKEHKFYTISNIYESKENLKVYRNTIFMKILNKLRLKNSFYINNKDLSISIGGSMYIENMSPIDRKRILGKNPYYILGSNFGPYETEEFYKKAYQLFENAQDVCFRDINSYNLFKKLPNVRYAPDIVFTLDKSKIRTLNCRKVVISVIDCATKVGKQYQQNYEKMIKSMIEFFIQNKYEVCLMSFCEIEKDEQAIEKILCSLETPIKDKIEKYYYKGNIQEALEVIAQSEIVVGSRFHANILGLLFEKTVIPIIYSNKTEEFLKDIQFEGKIIDIKKDKECILNNTDLLYKKDIKEYAKYAQQQFKKLDEVLKENVK